VCKDGLRSALRSKSQATYVYQLSMCNSGVLRNRLEKTLPCRCISCLFKAHCGYTVDSRHSLETRQRRKIHTIDGVILKTTSEVSRERQCRRE